MQQAQPARFGELFGSSWESFRQLIKLFIIGAVVFGLITGLFQGGFTLAFANAPQTLSFDGWGPIIALVAVLYVVMIIVGFANYLYYLIIAAGKQTSFGVAVKETISLILPSIGVAILTFIFTYVWIPLILLLVAVYALPEAFNPLLILAIVVLALVFGPRYVLAPVLLVVERKGARASVKRSLEISRGYWGKIVGNILLLSLIMVVIMMALGIVLGVRGGVIGVGAFLSMQQGVTVGTAIAGLLGLLMMLIMQLMQAFASIFLVKLTAAIVTHPRSN